MTSAMFSKHDVGIFLKQNVCFSCLTFRGFHKKVATAKHRNGSTKYTDNFYITPSTICTHWNMNTVLKLNFTTKIKNESVKVTT